MGVRLSVVEEEGEEEATWTTLATDSPTIVTATADLILSRHILIPTSSLEAPEVRRWACPLAGLHHLLALATTLAGHRPLPAEAGTALSSMGPTTKVKASSGTISNRATVKATTMAGDNQRTTTTDPLITTMAALTEATDRKEAGVVEVIVEGAEEDAITIRQETRADTVGTDPTGMVL